MLGSLVQAPERIPAIDDMFAGENPFYIVANRDAWSVMLSIQRDGGLVDSVTLSSHLPGDRSKADLFVSELVQAGVGPSFVDSYLANVRTTYLRRKIIQAASEASDQARDPQVKPELVLAGWRDSADYLASHRNGHCRFTLRSPDELLAMTFDDSDRILGDRLLAAGQSLVVAGAGGLGKSRLILQLAVSIICGRDFVGFETRGEGLKWLLFQCENSNRRLQADLSALRELVGQELWKRVNRQLSIHALESDIDGFVSLASDQVCSRLREAIRRTGPDVVVWDSLYNFAAGDLNADADMSETLSRMSRLSREGNPQRAIVAVHHALTGKAGAARATGYDRSSFGRNSKVLFAWTRAQVNVAPGSPDENPPLVLSCGKCSNGREFAPFAVRLNPTTMVYEQAPDFDVSAWQSDMAGKPQTHSVTVHNVVDLLQGKMTKRELVKAVMDETGCQKSIAYRRIDEAVRVKRIHRTPSDGTYVRR